MTDDQAPVVLLPKLITFREFAAQLAESTGRTPEAVHEWLRLQVCSQYPAFRHIKIGHRYYMTPELIEEYLAQHTKDPAPAPAAPDPLADDRARVRRKHARKAATRRQGVKAA
jgi:hypothetical protein